MNRPIKKNETFEIPAKELIESLDITAGDALPNPDTISYYVLEKERKVFLDYDVCVSICDIQRLIFRWNMEDKGKAIENRKPIWIYINSYGGDLDYCWSFIDVILASDTPVYTVNIGFAISAAALIFLSGEQRFMLPRAKVVIHEGSATLSGDAVKVMDASDSYRKELKRMKDFILSRTQVPPTVLSKKKNNDWEIGSDQCKQYGVCTHIVTKLSEIL